MTLTSTCTIPKQLLPRELTHLTRAPTIVSTGSYSQPHWGPSSHTSVPTVGMVHPPVYTCSPHGGIPRAPDSGDQANTFLMNTEHLLHKATPLRQRDMADLPNTEKQTQKVRQNEETKEYAKKQLVQTSEKEVNQTEVSNTSNKEFKIVVLKILPECRLRMEDHSESVNKEHIT